jgi:hypothetical protein
MKNPGLAGGGARVMRHKANRAGGAVCEWPARLPLVALLILPVQPLRPAARNGVTWLSTVSAKSAQNSSASAIIHRHKETTYLNV